MIIFDENLSKSIITLHLALCNYTWGIPHQWHHTHIHYSSYRTNEPFWSSHAKYNNSAKYNYHLVLLGKWSEQLIYCTCDSIKKGAISTIGTSIQPIIIMSFKWLFYRIRLSQTCKPELLLKEMQHPNTEKSSVLLHPKKIMHEVQIHLLI